MARKFWVALHRYLGLAMLLLLLVISATGSLLVFAHEIDAWLNPHLLRVAAGRPALAADELTRRIEQADPRLRVSLLPLHAPDGHAYEVRVVPRVAAAGPPRQALGFDRVLVDPATGQILGQRQWGAWKFDLAHFIPFMDALHRRLQLPGPWGMWLTGGVAIAWMLSSVLGAWLTVPRMAAWRQGFWSKWKPAWQIKRGAHASRVTLDLHRSAGLWSLPVAVVLGLSGVYFSLADEVFKPVVNWFSTVHPHPVRALPARPGPARTPAFGIEAAVEHARAQLAPPTQHYLPWYVNHLAKQGVYRIAFREPGMLERPVRLRYEQIYVDDQSGAVRARYGYHDATRGERWVIWQYPLHTGRAGGLWGRIVVLLAGLATCAIALTGLLVWHHRWRARRKAAQATARRGPASRTPSSAPH